MSRMFPSILSRRSTTRVERDPSSIIAQSNPGKTGTTPPEPPVVAPKRPKQQSAYHIFAQAGSKVSKVRWLNIGPVGIIPDASLPEYCVVGTWGKSESEASLWRLTMCDMNQTNNTSRFSSNDEEMNPELKLVQKFPVLGSVTDIVAIKNQGFALTTSLGAVSYFQLKDIDMDYIRPINYEIVASNVLHLHKVGSSTCAATGITALDSSVATVGPDGSIFEVTLDTCAAIHSYESVDAANFTCVETLFGRTIATGNNAGQVKVWDLRSGENSPAQTLNNLEDFSAATSIAVHPSQPHILLVGYNSGGTDLWDLRGATGGPIANLQPQDGGVSEIFFHPICPDKFYTCSQSGKVTHWFTAEDLMDTDLVQSNGCETDLNLGFVRKGLQHTTLYASPFPVNSINLSRHNRLISGGDSGIMFCSENC